MLEDLDFVDDIVLISSKYEHIQNKLNRLVHNAGKLGLKLNAQKCKVMRMNTRREDKVMIGREEVEDVEEFVYLGTTGTRLFQLEDLEHTAEHWSEYKNPTV